MMTTLQIVLALVGVVLIGAIVLYNIVQERRFRREAERMFSHRREDIMLGESVGGEQDESPLTRHISLSDDTPPEVAHVVETAERVAPEIDPAWAHSPRERRSAEMATPFAEDSVQKIEPEPDAIEPAPVAVADVSSRAAPESERIAVPLEVSSSAEKPASAPLAWKDELVDQGKDPSVEATPCSGLDAETEFIARIRFAAPSAANFGPLLTTLRRIGKPIRALGQRADGGCEPLTGMPRSAYVQVEIGMQLADRSGAVTHEQLDAFCRALYGFAAEGGGAVTCQDKQDALRAAKALDMLCMDVDVLIGLNVVASNARPFTSEVVHKQATDAGLQLGVEGVYHARDEFGQSLFTLANQDEQPLPSDGRGLAMSGLTLLFDVPRVADGLAVFDRMTRLGFDLAWRLEGRLVDDNGRAVSEESLNRDRTRLANFYARMESRGIPAGGERALRLFV